MREGKQNTKEGESDRRAGRCRCGGGAAQAPRPAHLPLTPARAAPAVSECPVSKLPWLENDKLTQ